MLAAIFLPRGRLDRLRFWRRVAIIGLASLVGELALLLLLNGVMVVPATALEAALLVSAGVALYAGVVAGIQRLHDRDLPAWWMLLALVPIGGAVWYLFANGTIPRTPGANRYGLPAGASGAAIADVFTEGAPPAPSGGKSRLVTTILLWAALLATMAATALLFQQPAPAILG